MTLQEIILDYESKTGKSASKIGEELGIARSTALRWESGQIKKVSKEIGKKLSKLVGYDVMPILKGYDTSAKLPVLGYAKAGYDMFAEENYLGEEVVSMEDIKKGDYYLKVEGSSMVGAGIMPGSLVLVHQTNVVESGKIAVVLIGDEVTIKRYVNKGKLIVLEAANPEVENRYFTKKEVIEQSVKIIGEVIAVKTYL